MFEAGINWEELEDTHWFFFTLWVIDLVIQIIQTCFLPLIVTRRDWVENCKSNFLSSRRRLRLMFETGCRLVSLSALCSHSPPEPPTPRCKLSPYSAGLSTKLRYVPNSLSRPKNLIFAWQLPGCSQLVTEQRFLAAPVLHRSVCQQSSGWHQIWSSESQPAQQTFS